MNIGFLITARLKSKRLPKKILLEVANIPLLQHMINRIKAAKRVNKIVVCTSINDQDTAIAKLAKKEQVLCFRGSEIDVLERLYQAAITHHIDYIVNITADCPMIDPFFIDQVVIEYEKTNAVLIFFDKLPLGQGPSGIKLSALKKICDLKDEEETEVWGKYFQQAGCFSIHHPEIEDRYIHSELKTSIDYPEDYLFIEEVFKYLYNPEQIFTLIDILKLVKKNKHLLDINKHCAQLGKEHIATTATAVKFK